MWNSWDAKHVDVLMTSVDNIQVVYSQFTEIHSTRSLEICLWTDVPLSRPDAVIINLISCKLHFEFSWV